MKNPTGRVASIQSQTRSHAHPHLEINLLMDIPPNVKTICSPPMAIMTIPTEPIGSIPRPAALLETIAAFHKQQISSDALEEATAEALRDTIHRLEQTGSPILTDGEQTKPSFATYPLSG